MRMSFRLALAAALALPVAGCIITDGDADGDTTTNGNATGNATDNATDTGDATGADETANPGSGGPGGGLCIHQCEADGDCTVDGIDNGLTCQSGFCTGEGSADLCDSDEACVAQLSGWSFGSPCTAGGGECDALMMVCLDVGGEGHCVTPVGEFFNCADGGTEEVETMDIDGNPVTVCGRPNAECGDLGFCFDPCTSDDACLTDSAPVCNTATGTCECGTDADCESLGMPQLSVCNAGACGCGEDQHCVDGNAGDVCNSGLCGCSADAACDGVDNIFDGGTIACVQF
ncbi:MAG: hypothetical protein K0V04_16780 [Deltaproteobacteria bacterium]|nr:hypothetical protein [Deltaproteobacteria bacterium]